MPADSSSVGNLDSCGLYDPKSSSLMEVVIWPKISSKIISHRVGERETLSVDMRRIIDQTETLLVANDMTQHGPSLILGANGTVVCRC